MTHMLLKTLYGLNVGFKMILSSQKKEQGILHSKIMTTLTTLNFLKAHEMSRTVNVVRTMDTIIF